MRKETAVIAIIVGVVAGFFAGSASSRTEPIVALPRVEPAAVAEVGAQRSALAATPAKPPGPPRVRRHEDPNAVYRVPVAGGEPTRGPANALVTIVEWTDFQCPFCGRVRATLAQVEEHYGRDVRIVVRMNPLPFHEGAMPAAEAAMAAHAQGKFWPMHDRIFADPQHLDRETFERHAREIGLDLARFRRDLDTHAHRAAIEAQQQAAAGLGARGTPSFFVNGRKLRGAQPFEGFRAAIDAALAEARQEERAGRVPRGRLYDHIVGDGASAPVFRPAPAPPSPADPGSGATR